MYCALEPTSFEAPMCAAQIFAEAARKNHCYRETALAYLEEALAKGMPIDWVSGPNLKSLLPDVKKEIREGARLKKPKERFEARPPNDPPATGDWKAFEREFGIALRPRDMNLDAIIR